MRCASRSSGDPGTNTSAYRIIPNRHMRWVNYDIICAMSADDTLKPEQVLKQVRYWLALSEYDLETARAMLISQRLLYVTFMCHQAVEKALKGLYADRCARIPPKIHGLVALATKSGIHLVMSREQQDFLEELDPMNIECRYPAEQEKLLAALTVSGCHKLLVDTEEVLGWIKQQFSNV